MRTLALSFVLSAATLAVADVNVTVDPAAQYQTIRGWGAASGGEDIPQFLRDQIHDLAVNDYGLTRLRLEPVGGNRPNQRRWEWDNDNGDPDVINWAAIDTSHWDKRISDWVVPFKQRVEANGDPFSLYVSPSFFDGGSSGTAPAWLLNSPGENAEYAATLLLHLKNIYGITADYYCILNEAGNNNAWTAAVVGRNIKALGPKLQQLGLPTKIQFPECLSADATWGYIQAWQNDTEIWPYIGMLSYHLYGGLGSRTSIRDFGLARGIPTGQTEYMGLTTKELYEDMTLGGTSYWEVYGYQGRGGSTISFNKDATQINGRGSTYWPLRQAMHYVRPGAVRIGATPDNANLKTLAFARNGKVTVVLINNITPVAAQNVVISGLPAGQYAASQVVSSVLYSELGVRTVAAGGTLTIPLPTSAVVTIYPYAGTNQPPVVIDWKTTPDYLTVPASTTTLSASAVDPELSPLSYAWSIKSKPAAATVVLATPNAASCGASGLTVAGTYTFTVTIGDGTNSVARDVTLKVHAGNEPPVPVDVHNRNPVMVIQNAGTMTWLRCGSFDLENNPVTYNWTVVSQPAGSNVTIAGPTSTNTPVVYMIPGDYVFRVAMSDPTHTVTEDLHVTVYPQGAAPAVSSAAATPPAVPAIRAGANLSAVTSDPDSDVITHWWSVKSAPAGTKPVFTKPGSATTTVSGLTAVGTYVFTLSVIDRNFVTNRDVTVTVTAQSTVQGDCNGDGYVNIFDLLLLANAWDTQTGHPLYDPAADLNSDGQVNIFDLLILADNWNT